jgi:hypothetical protein
MAEFERITQEIEQHMQHLLSNPEDEIVVAEAIGNLVGELYEKFPPGDGNFWVWSPAGPIIVDKFMEPVNPS